MTQNTQDDQETVNIVYTKDHVYSAEEKTYVFLFQDDPRIGQNLEIPEEFVQMIITLYSARGNYGWPVNKIANHLECTQEIIKRILKSLQVTHADVLGARDVDRILAECEGDGDEEDKINSAIKQAVELHSKRAQIKAKISKGVAHSEKQDAEKWRLLQADAVNPFLDALEALEPIEHRPIKRKLLNNDPALPDAVAMISDVHLGDALKAGEAFTGQEFDIDLVCDRLLKYAEFIVDKAASGAFNTNTCHLFFLGDLIDSLSGLTDKGTQLGSGTRGSDLFKISLQVFSEFLTRITDAFDEVHIYAVGGNHDSVADLSVVTAATLPLIGSGRLLEENVHVDKSQLASTDVRGTYLLYEHGYSPKYRFARVPTQKKPREAYILSYIAADPTARTGPDENRVFMCGDLHSQEFYETNGFTYVRNGALVNPNEYALANGYRSKPTQTVLGIDESGIACQFSFRA